MRGARSAATAPVAASTETASRLPINIRCIAVPSRLKINHHATYVGRGSESVTWKPQRTLFGLRPLARCSHPGFQTKRAPGPRGALDREANWPAQYLATT